MPHLERARSAKQRRTFYHTHTERQRDRQTDRDRETERQRETDRQTERDRERQRDNSNSNFILQGQRER